MNKTGLASLFFPIVLIAGGPPQKHAVANEVWAKSWVKDAIRLNKKKGIEFVTQAVKSPKGRFQSHQPEANPVLLIYSNTLEIITQNHITRDPGIVQLTTKDTKNNTTIANMRNFVNSKGSGWFNYTFDEGAGQTLSYKAYVGTDGVYLYTAIFRNPE